MTQLITQVRSEAPTGARALKALSAAVGVSRATFYRQHSHAAQRPTTAASETQLRQAIHHIAAHSNYGYRPMTAALRRGGLIANHKRVLRLMREESLLGQPRRSFVITTNPAPPPAVFPNLARELVVNDIDQLWVADITFIRLPRQFVYLAVLLDAFSRRVIGWSLERHLRTELTLTALRRALRKRQVTPALVHHSDRGVQYAAADYVSLLVKHRIRISMSRSGNPYDNAQAERFMRTIKHEEVLLSEYQTLAEARASIGRFIEHVYNRKRLHSALGYLPPVEFERRLSPSISA